VSTLYLPIAPPGAGKSTLASLMVDAGILDRDAVVCPDDFRRLLTGDENSQEENDLVFSLIQRIVEKRLSNGLDVYLDATNIGRTIREWRKRIDRAELPATITAIEFDLDEGVIRAQNAGRDRVVPENIMNNFIERWTRDSQIEAINACADDTVTSRHLFARASAEIEALHHPTIEMVVDEDLDAITRAIHHHDSEEADPTPTTYPTIGGRPPPGPGECGTTYKRRTGQL
jgi:predicted kinase